MLLLYKKFLAVYLFLLTGLASNGSNAAVIAESVADFSASQGQNGWHYGYFTTPGNPESFVQSTVYTSRFLYDENRSVLLRPVWQESNNDNFAMVWDKALHSNGINSGGEHWASRRWVSNLSGVLDFSGSVGRLDFGSATANIYINGDLKYSYNTDSMNILHQTNFLFQAAINAGDKVDFALNPNGIDNGDSTLFTARISTVPVPGAGWLLGSIMVGFIMNKNRQMRTGGANASAT